MKKLIEKDEWIKRYPNLKNYYIPEHYFFKTKLTNEACTLLPFIPENQPYLGVEIGVNIAKTSTILLYRKPQLNLILVDNWAEVPENKFLTEYHLSFFDSNRYKIIHENSRDAVKQIKQKIDFVFVAAHKKPEEYEHDILQWAKHVKPNGFLFGHDIGNSGIGPKDQAEKVVEYCAKKLGDKDYWVNSKRLSWMIKL